VVLGEIKDVLAAQVALDTRRQSILASLQEQNALTPELRGSVESAVTLTDLEDIYLPFRPKRRTRSSMAKDKGLEPLARRIMAQGVADVFHDSGAFVNQEKGVASPDEALAGARDIIAELISDDTQVRQGIRRLFYLEGVIQTSVVKGMADEGVKYRNYFDCQEQVARVPGHRVLAMLRGEKEGFLKIKIRPPQEKAFSLLQRRFVTSSGPASVQLELAIEDGYNRLLAPSIETSVRQQLKERADDEALRVFSRNLRQMLMAAPFGQRPVLAIDPGYRTGCKIVCLDPQGKLLANTVVYPGRSEPQDREAGQALRDLIQRYGIEAIAIGNGTGGLETEAFIRGLPLPVSIPIVMTNETGASIYSASTIAREEFPDHDITVRGAVSIGRRLQDPLAELVKIDPKSLGVGQYQHDVDQSKLRSNLDDTVVSCVNQVGVKVNSASQQLLTYVSGLGPTLAGNIIAYRNEHGPFHSRTELKKVPRLGPKAFELAAGFLRIDNADNPLDSSAVHPESYPLVDRMARDLGCSVFDLIHNVDLRLRINLEDYVGGDYGLPTLGHIIYELSMPGRDPRDHFEAVAFKAGVRTIDQLLPGMQMTGIVTNVTNFGVFVDIGVHQDGLVHISEMSDKYVRNPADIVGVNQKVMVRVLATEPERKRISLSMRLGSDLSSQTGVDNK
jgi:uncharacterized protein